MTDLAKLSLNVRLPEDMKKELKDRAAGAGYEGVSSWVEDLMRIALMRPPSNRDLVKRHKTRVETEGRGSRTKRALIASLQDGPRTSNEIANDLGWVTARSIAGRLRTMDAVENIGNRTLAVWRLKGDDREHHARSNGQDKREEANRLSEEWFCPACKEPITDWWPAVNKHLSDVHDKRAIRVNGRIIIKDKGATA